jgi:hypothetical protein
LELWVDFFLSAWYPFSSVTFTLWLCNNSAFLFSLCLLQNLCRSMMLHRNILIENWRVRGRSWYFRRFCRDVGSHLRHAVCLHCCLQLTHTHHWSRKTCLLFLECFRAHQTVPKSLYDTFPTHRSELVCNGALTSRDYMLLSCVHRIVHLSFHVKLIFDAFGLSYHSEPLSLTYRVAHEKIQCFI